MTELGFPKDSRAQATGRGGQDLFAGFVSNVLQWIFRPVHQESDFGIDGFVDIVDEGVVTGRSFAVQIKCGDSYVRKRTSGGIRYDGQNQHLNFYLNHNVPVVLVVLNGSGDEGYWIEFDIDRTTQTDRGWAIEIPKSNQLNPLVRQEWIEIAGPAEDFSSEIRTLWAIDTLLESIKNRHFSIPRDDVESCRLDRIQSVILKLSKTREATLKSRGTLNIFFTGYDEDPREVREIPEVRRWLEASTQAEIPWFYFLDTQHPAYGVRLLLLGMCKARVESSVGGPSPRVLLSLSGTEMSEWLQRHFTNLNRFAEKHGIPEEIVLERSHAIFEAVKQGLSELQVGESRMAPQSKKSKAKAKGTAHESRPRKPATKPKSPAKTAKKVKPVRLLSGGNPQIAKAEGDAPVQAYIAAMPDWKRDVGHRLDALVSRHVPNVRKAVKWNSPFYGIEGQGWFLSFHVFTRYVKVTFFRGTSLRPVPPEGTGKDARWVDVHEDDLDEAQMAAWVKQAAALPGWAT